VAQLMESFFRIAGRDHSLWLSEERPDRFKVHLGDDSIAVEAIGAPGIRRPFIVDGECRTISLAVHGDSIFIHLDGKTLEIEHVPAAHRYAGTDSGPESDQLTAPMPGAIVACAVTAGDRVEAGDLLMTIESMKLETSFKAWRSGVIEAVHVEVGQNFERHRILLSMMPEEPQ
jgi:acetyl/propionyl-CoA carboxylase alpha subunit